jgi:hypothetical protein
VEDEVRTAARPIALDLEVRGRSQEARMAGEAPIKQAVNWIDEQLRDNPGADRVRLVDEASRRFDLSPLDQDFLFRHLAERTRPKK